MGSGTWSDSDWKSYSSTVSSAKSTADVFSATAIVKGLDPLHIKLRESRDSAFNPQSTPIIAALDVTGSMGKVAVEIAKNGLGVLFTEILDRKPVSDPHLMFMGVGDVNFDRSPLQVSQFEADAKIIDQLTELFIEHGGGGNSSESYQFPWYFAAMHTSIDSFEKRGKKGYLFTMGDEETPPPLTPAQIERFTGDIVQTSLSAAECLAMAEKMYHVFHLIVEHRPLSAGLKAGWKDLMGQRAMILSDYTKLSEVIVSTIQVIEGEDAAKVASSWKGDTAKVVTTAIRDLVPVTKGSNAGVRKFT